MLRWTYKQGESESTGAGKDAELLYRLMEEGFRPVSYSHTYWSSDRHGWWIFEVHDLELFRSTMLELIHDQGLDRWMTIDITIGRSHSPPFVRLKVADITFDGSVEPVYTMTLEKEKTVEETVRVEMCSVTKPDCRPIDYYPIEGDKRPHEFTPQAVGPPGVVELGALEAIEGNTAAATFTVTARTKGITKLFVGTDVPHRGPAITVAVE